MNEIIKKSYYLGSLIIGISLFVFVMAQFGGLQKTLGVVNQIGWSGLIIFIALLSLTLIAPAVSWYILMKGEGLQVPLLTAIKANLMGFPINLLTPSMFLGGEPLKTYYVAHAHNIPKRKVLATIIVAKFQELGALLFTMLIAAAIIAFRLDISGKEEVVLIATLLGIILVFLIMLYTFVANHKPLTKLANFLSLLGISKMKKLQRSISDVEKTIHNTLTNHKLRPTLIKAQLVVFISAISIWSRPLIFYLLLQRALPPFGYSSAIYLTLNIINILPLTPGGLGFLEGGMVGIFTLLGFQAEQANAFSILLRISDLTLFSLGAWMIFHYGLQAIAKHTTKEKSVKNH